jgi:CheY-like chemotaxis protein
LLGNAVKFTYKGGVKLTLMKDMNYESLISFSVQDTGIGISKEVIPNLFKLSLRGDLVHEQKFSFTSGVGLGLAIAKILVGLLGPDRKIHLTTEVGHGSEFSFVIFDDLSKIADDSIERTRSGPSQSDNMIQTERVVSRKQLELLSSDEDDLMFAPSSKTVRANSPKTSMMNCSKFWFTMPQAEEILVVDDTAFNIDVLENFFKGTSAKIIRAFNGEQAIELARNQEKNKKKCSVIFMDCNMPVMDGFSAARELKRMMELGQISTTSIIGLTAFVGEGIVRRCLESGMDDYISKPSSKDTIISKYNQWKVGGRSKSMIVD